MTSFKYFLDDSLYLNLAGPTARGQRVVSTLLEDQPTYLNAQNQETKQCIDARQFFLIKKPLTLEIGVPNEVEHLSLTSLEKTGKIEELLKYESVIRELVIIPVEKGCSPLAAKLARTAGVDLKSSSMWYSKTSGGLRSYGADSRVWQIPLMLLEMLYPILPRMMDNKPLELIPLPMTFLKPCIESGRLELYDAESRLMRSSKPEEEMIQMALEMEEALGQVLNAPWLSPKAVKEIINLLEDWKEYILGVKTFRTTIAAMLGTPFDIPGEIDPDTVLSRSNQESVFSFSKLTKKLSLILERIELLLLAVRRKEINEKFELNTMDKNIERKTVTLSKDNYKELLVKFV